MKEGRIGFNKQGMNHWTEWSSGRHLQMTRLVRFNSHIGATLSLYIDIERETEKHGDRERQREKIGSVYISCIPTYDIHIMFCTRSLLNSLHTGIRNNNENLDYQINFLN